MKSLLKYIIEAMGSVDIEVKNVKITYIPRDKKDIIVQVPEDFDENKIQLYIDDVCLQNMPSGEQNIEEMFGKDNAIRLSDAYFEYDKISVPTDGTVEPDIKYESNKSSDDSTENLTVYSIDNLKYIVTFDSFTILNTKESEIDDILEKVIKETESSKLHEWAIEIKLDKIEHE